MMFLRRLAAGYVSALLAMAAVSATVSAAAAATGAGDPGTISQPTAGPGQAAHASYPARPVRLVVPAAEGTYADPDSAALARLLAGELGRRLGQPFTVETVPGAAGITAMERVAHAEPDGYTLALGTMASTTLAPALHDRLPYDPATDFMPLARVGTSSAMLVARSDFAADGLQDLVRLARAADRPFRYATPGQGAIGRFCAAVLAQKTGVDLEPVPFEGAVPVVTALLDDVVKVGWVDVPTGAAALRTGKVKPLAMCTARAPNLPDVATFREQGVDFGLWTGWALYAPAGLARPVAGRIAEAVRAALGDPAVVAAMRERGIAPDFLSGDEHALRNARDIALWKRIAREAGIRAPRDGGR